MGWVICVGVDSIFDTITICARKNVVIRVCMMFKERNDISTHWVSLLSLGKKCTTYINTETVLSCAKANY